MEISEIELSEISEIQDTTTQDLTLTETLNNTEIEGDVLKKFKETEKLKRKYAILLVFIWTFALILVFYGKIID